MIFFSYLLGIIFFIYLANKLFGKINDLERRVDFLEDRSLESRRIRELEDKERGWPQATDDLRELMGHVLSVDFAHNAAIRTLLAERPELISALEKFRDALPSDSDADKLRISAVKKILKPIEYGH